MREKTFTNLMDLEPPAKDFSTNLGRAVHIYGGSISP